MNYANADMVGHSGKIEPTVRAVETVDAGLGKLYAALQRKGGRWIITADHGNAELMYDEKTKQPHTAHTTNQVPLIFFDPQHRFGKLRGPGALENVAPTLLEILGIEKPKEMTAESLLE